MRITYSQTTDGLEVALTALARGDTAALTPYLYEIASSIKLSNTLVNVHCHCLKLDGNGRPRLNDLIAKTAQYILNFAIPRSHIKDAIEKAQHTGDTSQFAKLHNQARNLFTTLIKSGEGGELLLFVIAETYLYLPQLLCKMDFKTDEEMHIHGADGVHCGLSRYGDRLCLYWGESKVYKNFTRAVTDCLRSLAPILKAESTGERPIARELQLLTRRLDLANEKLQEKLLFFLDPDEEGWNQTEMCGVCLVAFDYHYYPEGPSKKTVDEIAQHVTEELPNWIKTIKDNTNKVDVQDFHIHFVLLPIPSSQEFRHQMRAHLGVTDE